MKKKEIGSLLLILLFAGVAFLPLSAEVTMDQAIREGVKLNKAYKNHVIETRSLKLAKKNARMKRWFNLDSGASYLYKSEQMEISFPDSNPAPGVGIPGMAMSVGTKHNYDLKLSLTQPIFTGNILKNAAKLESVKMAVEKNRVRLSRVEAAAEIKRSYFNYQLLRNRMNSLQVLLKQLQLHHGKLQDYFREELIRKSDLLETEAKIREQELNLRDLQNLVENEKINFKNLCGFDIDEIEKNYSEKSGDFDRVFSEFKTGHPVIKTLDEQAAGFQIREKMVNGAYLPQVGGFAEIHYGKPGIDFFQNEWSFYFQGGISLNLKVFDWNKRKRDVQITRYGREKLENERSEFIKVGEKHLKQLFSSRTAAEEKLATIEKLVRIAVEDIGLKENLLKEQQIDNIDYLSALTRKERYESMEDTIRAQLEIIKVNINLLVGRFEEAK